MLFGSLLVVNGNSLLLEWSWRCATQVSLRTLAAFTELRTQQVLDDAFNASSVPAGAVPLFQTHPPWPHGYGSVVPCTLPHRGQKLRQIL